MPTTYPAWLLTLFNYLERIFFTFVEVFITFALAQGVLDWNTAQAAAAAAAAACLTIVLGLLTDWAIPTDLPFGILAVLRILRTWVVAVLTIVLSSNDLTAHGWQLALVASVPAVLAAVKAIAAERIGGQTPALLPAKVDVLAVGPNLTFGA